MFLGMEVLHKRFGDTVLFKNPVPQRQVLGVMIRKALLSGQRMEESFVQISFSNPGSCKVTDIRWE
jgi:hypothetical protein